MVATLATSPSALYSRLRNCSPLHLLVRYQHKTQRVWLRPPARFEARDREHSQAVSPAESLRRGSSGCGWDNQIGRIPLVAELPLCSYSLRGLFTVLPNFSRSAWWSGFFRYAFHLLYGVPPSVTDITGVYGTIAVSISPQRPLWRSLCSNVVPQRWYACALLSSGRRRCVLTIPGDVFSPMPLGRGCQANTEIYAISRGQIDNKQKYIKIADWLSSPC